MVRDDLERALAEQFDAEHLSVYGDYLQSIGDPRGDLIAFDLHELDDAVRRDQLIVEWLGSATAALLATAAIEHGFITDLYLDPDDGRSEPALDAILVGPGAPYLRGVTIRGDGTWMRLVLEKLVARPHTWLQRLSVQALGYPAAPAIGDELARALVRAAPRLEQLEVWGRRVFGGLAHDALRSLCVTGYDAVGTLLERTTGRFPAAVVLDLAFHVEGDSAPVDRKVLDGMLDPERLPKLRRLDLSRNEPGITAPHYLGGRNDAARFLAGRAIRRQLTHVRLPSVRSQAQADQLAAAAAGMPALRELSIVRSYRRLPHVTLPPVATESSPLTWLPADLVPLLLHAETPTTELMLRLPPLVRWLEHHLAELPAAARTTWLELFDSLDYHGTAPNTRLPRRRALTALAALDLEAGALDTWLRLRKALEELDDHDHVHDHVVFREV